MCLIPSEIVSGTTKDSSFLREPRSVWPPRQRQHSQHKLRPHGDEWVAWHDAKPSAADGRRRRQELGPDTSRAGSGYRSGAAQLPRQVTPRATAFYLKFTNSVLFMNPSSHLSLKHTHLEMWLCFIAVRRVCEHGADAGVDSLQSRYQCRQFKSSWGLEENSNIVFSFFVRGMHSNKNRTSLSVPLGSARSQGIGFDERGAWGDGWFHGHRQSAGHARQSGVPFAQVVWRLGEGLPHAPRLPKGLVRDQTGALAILGQRVLLHTGWRISYRLFCALLITILLTLNERTASFFSIAYTIYIIKLN